MKLPRSLSQVIGEYISLLERKNNLKIVALAKSAFGINERGKPATYGFKNQYGIDEWLDRPIQVPMMFRWIRTRK